MSMNKKIKSFEGLNVWLIGASTGIGRALSEELLKRGALIKVSSRKKELLDEIKSIKPHSVEVHPLDVLNLDELKAAYSKMNQVDMVIYLAADYSPMGIGNLDPVLSGRIIDVNLKGAVNVTSVVMPTFIKEKRGHISLVASIAGYIGLPQSCIYGATKAGLINFCESIYTEAKVFNVDVSMVNPGFVKTNLTDKNTFEMPFIMSPPEAAQP